MKSSNEIRSANGPVACPPAAAPDEVDATLSVIAKLPAPAGLEDRVFATVVAAPRGGRVLTWPQPTHTHSWMRSAAAAAIVLVVGGGGWGIYSHVEQSTPTRAVVMPRRVVPQQGAFSSAGAIRTPQTLNGPVLKKAPKATPAVKAQPELKKTEKKVEAQPAAAQKDQADQAEKKPETQHDAAVAK